MVNSHALKAIRGIVAEDVQCIYGQVVKEVVYEFRAKPKWKLTQFA